MKIEKELDNDDKTKEAIAAQIRVLQEKQEQLDHQMNKRKLAYAKINDALEQSEMGYSKIIDSLQVLLNFAASKTENDNDLNGV